MVVGPLGRQLSGGPQEHQEGGTSLGLVREVSAEIGGGSISLEKVLPHGGTTSVDI